MRMGSIVGLIVGIAIAAIIVSAIIPTALTNIAAANTTSWDAGSIAVWGLLTIVICLAIVLAFFKYVGV
jgi:CHASE2 domain-containing sensor protein